MLTLEEYAAGLREVRKRRTGDRLTESTIERYGEYIKRFMPILRGCQGREELVGKMAEAVKSSESIVMFSAFKHYLRISTGDGTGLPEKNIWPASAVRSVRFLQGNVLSREQMRKLLEETPDEDARRLFSVAYDTWCRRAELLSMKVEMLEPYGPERIAEAIRMGKTPIYADVRILGKGEKWRTVCLGERSAGLLGKVGLKSGDRLFPYTSESQLNYVCRKWGKRILGTHVHPHMFRHTGATHAADRGAETLSLMAYGGWSDIRMVKIYVDLSSWKAQQAFLNFAGSV